MSTFEVNEVWNPAMGARVLDDIAFRVMLEQIRGDLGPGASVTGSVSRVLVTVKIDARSEEKAQTEARTKIAQVMRDRPFIIDGTTSRTGHRSGPRAK